MSHLKSGLVTLLAAGMLCGCNTGSSGTVPVTGKITKGGQPVPGAAVSFIATAADGKPAAGFTDESGVYKLTTFVNGDGALPGSYKVTVTKFPGAAPAPAGGAASGGDATQADIDAAYKAAEQQGGMDRTSKQTQSATNELPAKYASPDTSGLTAEVKSGGNNTFDFDVTQ